MKLSSSRFLRLEAFQFVFHPLLAAVAAAVLFSEGLLLRIGAKDLAPLPILEDDLISTRKDLERCGHLIHLVELYRVRLAKNLEIRWVHEVAQRNSVDVEGESLDRVGALVSVDCALLRTRD